MSTTTTTDDLSVIPNSSNFEDTGREPMGPTEQAWAADQRQLRTQLITYDDLDFCWTAPCSNKPDARSNSLDLEKKVDSEEVHGVSQDAARPVKPPLQYIGGVDISFVGEGNDEACAALVVVEVPGMKIVYQDYQMITMTEPYIPGFLAFREVQHLLNLLDRLRSHSPHLIPQIIMVDGNGLLHHRGFGLACHLGVLSNIPTIGVGKNLLMIDGLDRLVVQAQATKELKRGGDAFDLVGKSGTVWGSCLRSTDASSNPIFVSIGHRISLPTATSIVHTYCRHRIPEPVRLADLNSREFIRQWKAQHPVLISPALPSLPASTTSSTTTSASSSFSSQLRNENGADTPNDTERSDDTESSNFSDGTSPPKSSPLEQKTDAESHSNLSPKFDGDAGAAVTMDVIPPIPLHRQASTPLPNAASGRPSHETHRQRSSSQITVEEHQRKGNNNSTTESTCQIM